MIMDQKVPRMVVPTVDYNKYVNLTKNGYRLPLIESNKGNERRDKTNDTLQELLNKN